MRRNEFFSQLIIFLAVSTLPFIKIHLLKIDGPETQLEYIKAYFLIQFIVPLIDGGAYWRDIRGRIQEKIDTTLQGLSGWAFLAALTFATFDMKIALIILLSGALAWYNYTLQILRIESQSTRYYSERLLKIFIDLLLICLIYFLLESVNIYTILVSELLAVVITISIRKKHVAFQGVVTPFIFERPSNSDFAYVTLKTLRAHIFRVTIPYIYIESSIARIFIFILIYEIGTQFIATTFMRSLLDSKIVIKKALLVYAITIPLQIVILVYLGELLTFELAWIELICITFAGSARVLSIYTFTAVKNAYKLVTYSNNLILGVAIMLLSLAIALPKTDDIQYSILMTYFSIETLISLALIMIVEKKRIYGVKQ